MPSTRDPRSIRPSLLVFAALFVAVLALITGRVIAPSAGERDDHAASDRHRADLDDRDEHDDHPDDRGWSARVEDPGASGSAREAWAEVFVDTAEPLPPIVEALVDPQMSRYRARYTDESPAPFAPLGRRGRVRHASGLDLDSAEPCVVRVLPANDGGFNCLVRVMCGDTVVYPNRAQTAGYVACELDGASPTRAADALPSVTDGDPAVSFDLAQGTVTVHDADASGRTLFDLTLDLDPDALRVM